MNQFTLILFPAAAVLAGVQIFRLLRHGKAAGALSWALYLGSTLLLAAGLLLQFLPEPEIPTTASPTEHVLQSTDAPRETEDVRSHFSNNGAMPTGWVELDGSRYYFHADGTLARGRTEIDGKIYFFTSTGAQTLLVNPWNPVPEDYTPDLVEMDELYGKAGLEIDRSCYDALKEMIDACNAESGSRAYVLSAYRSCETQQQLFDRKVRELLGQGLSQADAEKEAATVVAVPGTSEHHLGLAVDIIDTRRWQLDEGQEDTAAQKWLMENSWRYGFIFRYPKDKIEITGIIYEPWHYRYVGTELAAELHETGLTMEEYIDSLS